MLLWLFHGYCFPEVLGNFKVGLACETIQPLQFYGGRFYGVRFLLSGKEGGETCPFLPSVQSERFLFVVLDRHGIHQFK